VVWLIRKFKIKLDERWCNYEMFQTLHLPCSYVFDTSTNTYYDFDMYTNLVNRPKEISKIYDNLFGKLRHKDYWPNTRE